MGTILICIISRMGNGKPGNGRGLLRTTAGAKHSVVTVIEQPRPQYRAEIIFYTLGRHMDGE